MTDRAGPLAPISNVAAVTPSNSADLTVPCRAILLDTDAYVAVDMEGVGTNITLTLAGGIWHPMRVTRVYATGTTAGTVHAGW